MFPISELLYFGMIEQRIYVKLKNGTWLITCLSRSDVNFEVGASNAVCTVVAVLCSQFLFIL